MKETFLQRFSKLGSTSTVSKLTKEAAEEEQITIQKIIFCMAIIALVWIPVQASAQLTLDNYTTPQYVKRLTNPQVHDLHYVALPPNSPSGAARQTYFGASPNPYTQTSTLDVGAGHFIIDSGFGAVGNVQVGYGFMLSGTEVPLGLNLGGYSALRLNFAGVATSEALAVVIVVYPHDGEVCGYEVVLPPNGNPFAIDFPFSGFNKAGGLTQAEVSDIDFIVVEAQGGGFASFGITSFQAVN
jgi:hypothetical protein